MNKACFECDYNQMRKISEFCHLDESITKQLFDTTELILSQCDMSKTNPEIMGEIWQAITRIINNDDPYQKIKHEYNMLLLSMKEDFARKIESSSDSFTTALKIAITANLIDFAAKHSFNKDSVQEFLNNAVNTTLAIDHSQELKATLKKANTLLCLGDNCGEIVLDKLFIEEIRKNYPTLNIYYGVRGKPIVNDVTLIDAKEVNMEEVATVISNGDGSLGTVLEKTSPNFQQIFHDADVVICKGQGNYEGLLGNEKENIFFMFMAKCELVAKSLGIHTLGIVCLKNDLR